MILMLHLGSGRPGFSLSVGRASLVFGAELTRTAGVLAVDRSSNPAVTDSGGAKNLWLGMPNIKKSKLIRNIMND